MNTLYTDFFDQIIKTKFIANITNTEPYRGLEYAMFKALWGSQTPVSCERLCINGKNGLRFESQNSVRLEGFDIEAEDPRLIEVCGVVYAIFICNSIYPNQKKCIAITPFDEFKPVFLQLDGIAPNLIEKNWAPFEKNGKLYFVYNYDPLVILHYDFNSDGICKPIYLSSGVRLPINTNEPNFLRGGSNLVPLNNHLYVGGCHSRIFKEIFYHFTHIVILDTDTWEVRYLSKPVLYHYSYPDLGTLPMSDVLFDIHPNCIQDPISLLRQDDIYQLSINVRDSVSLLYEIEFPIDKLELQAYTRGELQQLTKGWNEALVNAVTMKPKRNWFHHFFN